MKVRLRALEERLRGSLFFVPMLFVVGAIVVGEAMLLLDERVDDVPRRFTSTVDSARSVLALVGGATMTFAGIAFSVSLLLISQASSQYSPRVVHGLFRDPFNKRVIGVVVGTFTYCLVVMRSVRGPLEGGGEPTIPNLAVAFAVVLGIVAILATVAFISHVAHTLDVSTILHRVTDESIAQVRAAWPESPDDGYEAHRASASTAIPDPTGDALVIAADTQGWVQQIDEDRLLECIPPGTTLRLDTAAGRYAISGTPLAHWWPAPTGDDGATRERAVTAAGELVRSALVVGDTRTLQQDVSYGVRQIADVALKALSPGVNDPTTAQDAMFHLASVLEEILRREPPARRRTGDDGRVLIRGQALTHAEAIDLAFDEVRLAAASQPTVLVYLLEILEQLVVAIGDRGDRRDAVDALRRQAALILDTVALADLPDADSARVRAAYRHRFAT